MSSILENPFTPKSAIPAKRLFGGEEKRRLGQKARERIKEVKEEFVLYGDKKILKSQADFLKKIENQLLDISRKYQNNVSQKEAAEKLAQKIQVDSLGYIIDLNLGNLFLTGLPSIDKLKYLENFDCMSNFLTSLPKLDKLTNLVKLNCSFNRLTELPDLDKLNNLLELDCENNRLVSLLNLASLTNLKFLGCDENKLTSLPGLEKLKNLSWLSCLANKFSEQEIAKIKSQVPENCAARI